MTKLYLIERLPCSGKSTTARYVARKLDFLNKLEIPSLILSNPQRDWQLAYRQINRALE